MFSLSVLIGLWTTPFPLIPIHKFKKKKEKTITMTIMEYKNALNTSFNEGYAQAKRQYEHTSDVIKPEAK